MESKRRDFLGGVAAAGAASVLPGAEATGPDASALQRAAAQPVLRLSGIRSPVVIDSVRLLKKGSEHFIHVRSKDGAEGISLANPGRANYLDKLAKQLVMPFFVGKDARGLENLLWELYRSGDNYQLQGLAFWSAQAWVECAMLDRRGRVAAKPMGALFGDVVRKEVACYVASGRRDTTPEQEIEHLRGLIAESGCKAVKFRLGGRMSRNADASPGRTERLIPLVRKTFGDAIDIHGDANSSYDAPHAIKIGKLLEDVGAVYFEEPCEFDNLEGTKAVADALTIPVAGGEQEFSEHRFRWMIAHRGVDIVQPDLHYYGGMIRSIRVARMAALAQMPTTVHISGGFGFIYMLHFASCVPDVGKYQEYKLGREKYDWFDPPLSVKDGKMTLPHGPGVGIRDVAAVLKGAVEV